MIKLIVGRHKPTERTTEGIMFNRKTVYERLRKQGIIVSELTLAGLLKSLNTTLSVKVKVAGRHAQTGRKVSKAVAIKDLIF